MVRVITQPGRPPQPTGIFRPQIQVRDFILEQRQADIAFERVPEREPDQVLQGPVPRAIGEIFAKGRKIQGPDTNPKLSTPVPHPFAYGAIHSQTAVACTQAGMLAVIDHRPALNTLLNGFRRALAIMGNDP